MTKFLVALTSLTLSFSASAVESKAKGRSPTSAPAPSAIIMCQNIGLAGSDDTNFERASEQLNKKIAALNSAPGFRMEASKPVFFEPAGVAVYKTALCVTLSFYELR